MTPWRIYVERARQAALGITVTVAFTSGAIYVFSNATYYGLRKFRRRHELRADANRPSILSENLESLVWETMDYANVSGYQRGNLMFFSSTKPSAEPSWKGSLYMRSGGAIGIPFFYNWPCSDNINVDIILKMWNIETSKLNESDLQDLKSCLSLSDNAKKYAIGRTLSLMYNNEILYGILQFEFFLFTSLTTATFAWNAHARAVVNGAGFLVNYCLWRLITLWYRRRIYRNGVKSAVSLSPNMADGAEEFYSKTIKLEALISKLQGIGAIVNPLTKFWSYCFAIRPVGLSLENERSIALETRDLLHTGIINYKPLFRLYGANRKRMAMPPVPILPTSEAVSEPEKFLKRSGFEGDIERELVNDHFPHLQGSNPKSENRASM